MNQLPLFDGIQSPQEVWQEQVWCEGFGDFIEFPVFGRPKRLTMLCPQFNEDLEPYWEFILYLASTMMGSDDIKHASQSMIKANLWPIVSFRKDVLNIKTRGEKFDQEHKAIRILADDCHVSGEALIIPASTLHFTQGGLDQLCGLSDNIDVFQLGEKTKEGKFSVFRAIRRSDKTWGASLFYT